MDAQAQKKALFHAKLKEASQKLEKCIDSPLVRYIEYDRPVCRVCDVILKSESLWSAHQASRKHHEAINNLKSSVTKQNFVEDVKSDPAPEVIPKSWPALLLPAHFLDKNVTKKLKGGFIWMPGLNKWDEYKEFEKAIQEDSQEVDERLQEEEIDAAEMMEAESFEQRAFRERVEMLKKLQGELKTAKLKHGKKKGPVFKGQESSEKSSSDDDDDDDGNFAVDWRAKHL